MREILFRGKRLDNGEWVKGFITSSCDCAGRLYFIEQPALDLDDCNHSYEVDFTTIGQYTGLNDKDGTKIFEGDIVEFTDFNGDTTPYEVFYDGNNGKFAIAENGNRNFDDGFELFERNEYFKWFTVIGNIYDNPEFLKIYEKLSQL